MGDSGFNLSTVFATLAKTLPDHRALIWRGREWTYAELDARVDGVAHYLASLGLGQHMASMGADIVDRLVQRQELDRAVDAAGHRASSDRDGL